MSWGRAEWDRFLADVELPEVHPVRQRPDAPPPIDVGLEIDRLVGDWANSARCSLRSGMRVAVAVGSRGVANIAIAVGAVVRNLVRLGVEPSVVPAMGSHGASTAAGQAAVLASMGVDEAGVGASVVSTLDTVSIGSSPSGVPVFFDAAAAEADALVAINRIKPHTGFVGRVESGVCKMLAVGLGNQKGAATLHGRGMAVFPELIPEVGSYVARTRNLVFGIGLVENQHHQTSRVAILHPDRLVEEESVLLSEARRLVNHIPASHLHVLVVREIGKDISGEGMDPNVIGRYVTSAAKPVIDIQKIVVLGLSPGTGANANGIGLADITVRRVADQTDYLPMYINAITARHCEHVRMPLTLDTDENAIKAAAKSLWGVSGQASVVKLAVIKNTLDLSEMLFSSAALTELEGRTGVEVGEPRPLMFAEDGSLL